MVSFRIVKQKVGPWGRVGISIHISYVVCRNLLVRIDFIIAPDWT